MVQTARPLKDIEEEIAKCEVRCSNCHRIKTAAEHGHHKYVIKEGVDIGWKTRELFSAETSFKEKGLIPSSTLAKIDEELKSKYNEQEWIPDFISLAKFKEKWYSSSSIRQVGRRTGIPNEICKREAKRFNLTFDHFTKSRRKNWNP